MQSLRPSILHSALCSVLSSVALIASLHVIPARAAVPNYLQLAQTPAVTALNSIAPNIIFMLDDSGSMQWEFLGNRVTGFVVGFPHGSPLVYGGYNYLDQGPDFSAKNEYAANYRNSFTNPNYYDPAVTYTPWACAAPYPESKSNPPPSTPVGACQWNTKAKQWQWPDAKPGKAYQNPEDTTKGFRSIKVWNDSDNPNSKTTNNGFAGNNSGYAHGGPTYWYISSAQWVKGNRPFWPATYFNYFGPRPGTNSDWHSLSNFTRIQICPASSTTNSNGKKSTTHCTPPVKVPTTPLPYHTYVNTAGNYVYIQGDSSQVLRSPGAELKNFANWYQYYRSHILLARAGISQAFMGLPEGFRVDFSLLTNIANGNAPQYAVTDNFGTSERATFLSDLFKTPGAAWGGTPSRDALVGIGNWLSQSPSKDAPWGTSPAERNANNGANSLSCRPNYLVFVTDGSWNGNDPNVGNADNKTGPSVTGPKGASYQYSPAHPYQDSHSDTFADVAFKYWENDLQSTLTNDVPTSAEDPAFWQHLVTFDVGLGVTPSLITSYQSKHPGTSTTAAQAAVYALLQAGTTAWPNPTNKGHKIDDLWHGGVDGHGSFLSASNPTVFVKSLQSTLFSILNRTQSSGSAAVNTQQASEVKTSTQAYFSLFHPQNWWGQITAYSFTHDAQGYLQIANTANWDGSCVLTGGSCPALGSPVKTIAVQSPSSRTILSWNDTKDLGIPFSWAALTAAQQADLGNSSTGPTLLNYIRGVRSQEQSQPGGTLRTRTSVLGDIVDSSPTWVGPPSASYTNSWLDALYPAGSEPENLGGAQTYSAFKQAEATRNNIVYVGSNDGMLHAFQAGSYSSTGSYIQATNNGKEVLAFVPSVVLSNLKNYADPNYNHQYFVDATPGTGDLFYKGAWHTWLVGGMGAGGSAIYALNITHPSQFSQTNASSLVVKEITPTSLSCINKSACGADLGSTFGTPIIRRFHNGDWGVVFGNGYNSTRGTAAIYIALIDPNTGGWNTYQLSTGDGPTNDPTGANRPNGIAYVTSADLDGDHISDYLYAGDLFGNVWRFDVTSSNPADWHVSKYGTATATPLYTAVNAAGTSQPITTRVLAMSLPAQGGAKSRVLISFGTGSKIQISDQTPNTTASGVQTMYGIWDWDMDKWDTGTTTASGITIPASYHQYAYLSGSPTVDRNTLQMQSIIGSFIANGSTYTGTGTGYRTLTSNTVCWKGSATCSGGSSANQQQGWYLDLTDSPTPSTYTGESVVYNPVLALGVIQVNTRILPKNVGLTCTASAITGWTMAFNPQTGGAMKQSFFGDVNHKFVAVGGGIVGGISTGATGSPTVLADGTRYYDISQSTSASPTPPLFINRPVGGQGGRVTWVELR